MLIRWPTKVVEPRPSRPLGPYRKTRKVHRTRSAIRILKYQPCTFINPVSLRLAFHLSNREADFYVSGGKGCRVLR